MTSVLHQPGMTGVESRCAFDHIVAVFCQSFGALFNTAFAMMFAFSSSDLMMGLPIT